MSTNNASHERELTHEENQVLSENFHRMLWTFYELSVVGQRAGFNRHDWAALNDPLLMARIKKLKDAHYRHLGWVHDSIRDATKILGPENVLHHYDIGSVWATNPDVETDESSLISYWREMLNECASENMKGACWRLFYCHGFSLNQLLDQCRSHIMSLLGGSIGLDISLDIKRGPRTIFTAESVAKYRLVDFKPRFKKSPAPGTKVEKLGADYSIAHPAIVVEGILSFERFGDSRIYGTLPETGCYQREVFIFPKRGDNYLGIDIYREEDAGVMVERQLYKL